MDPVPVPADATREAWERLAQDRMLRALQDGEGLAPLDVADGVWRRIEGEFATKFPTGEFPLERTATASSKFNGEPADMQTLAAEHPDRMHWFVAAMPREANGTTLVEDVEAGELASIAANYDPTWRPAPVILPNDGPSHFTGEFSRFIPARVAAAQWDGYLLWLMAEEDFPGVLSFNSANQRSIGWWPELSEVPGADDESQSYLIHCALLTGEQPAIPNMLPLDHFFAESAGMNPERIAALDSVPMRFLSVSPTPEAATMAKDTKTTIIPTDDDSRVLALSKAFMSFLTPGSKPADPPVEPTKAKVEPAPADPMANPQFLAALTGAFAEAVKPLTDELSGLKGELAETRTAAEGRLATARRQLVEQSLDLLVQKRQLTPPARDLWIDQLTAEGVTEESASETLTKLASLPATAVPTTAIPMLTEGDRVEYVDPPRHLSMPSELGYTMKPEGVALEARARAAAAKESDEDRARQVYSKTLADGLGDRANSQRLPFDLH